MNTFEFLAPLSLEETLSELHQRGDEAKLLAGGTGLVNMMKQRLVNPSAVISLGRLQGLAGFAWDSGMLRVGALATHHAVEASADVRSRAPLLAETFAQVATPRIRNVATAGGSLAHGDPNQDPPVALLALDASVRLVSSGGDRLVPLTEFMVDYYETAIRPVELLTEIVLPLPPAGAGGAYLKFLPRTADDYATVSAAALIAVQGGRISEVRVAVGSVGPTALRCTEAERLLTGEVPSLEAIRAAAETVRAIVDPISDGRGSAAYKTDMTPVFVRRALLAALHRAGATVAGEERAA